MCDADGASARVTFTHQAGNLPNLKVTSSLTQSSATPTLTIKADGTSSSYGSTTATVTGNRVNAECSNRGICNSANGVCTCASWDGSTSNLWSSSNGAGGMF